MNMKHVNNRQQAQHTQVKTVQDTNYNMDNPHVSQCVHILPLRLIITIQVSTANSLSFLNASRHNSVANQQLTTHSS